MITVDLRELDEHHTERLLAVAVAEADPGEVMPDPGGPPGWTPARREAFRAFHRAHFGGARGTVMYAVEVDGEPVGMIRLARLDSPGAAETGIWLGRAHRGRGIGTAALRALVANARERGVRRIVADTTAGNTAARRVLQGCGATLTVEGDTVVAELPTG